MGDKFNHVLGNYIPDVYNHELAYVIEVDGSVHDTPEQQERDRKKDAYYRERMYQVFRVKAYRNGSFKRFQGAMRAHLAGQRYNNGPRVEKRWVAALEDLDRRRRLKAGGRLRNALSKTSTPPKR
jgi:hypothetical protein